MKLKKELLGAHNFPEFVDITDPCYDHDVWCRMNNVQISAGTYVCAIWKSRHSYTYEGKRHYYRRVRILSIYKIGVSIPNDEDVWEEIGEIGVDAGLAGIFHSKPDYNDEQWADFCDQMSHCESRICDEGFVASSGDGDGCYPVYAYRKDGEIVALEIRF